ncbi:MAG: hypothetical protein IMZ55_13340 [Acidobacteria bacterium]|nr:hypothetical protein [Acidobacteriota bacterium]MBE3134452.1 hypothetical protein [Acidobacteriota bacterium]
MVPNQKNVAAQRGPALFGHEGIEVRLPAPALVVRLARREGWKDEENLGGCLAGKLAMARIGQARYVTEMYKMGLARGKAEDDCRMCHGLLAKP